jgi:hypothetical protein
MESWEIEARLGVDALFGEYVRFVDAGRPELLAELFTADCLYDMDNGNIARGREEIPDRVRALIPMFASAVNFGRLRHHMSSRRIEFEGPERAKVTSAFLAVSGQGPDHWGSYRDVVVREPGGWRFSQRVARVEGAVPHSPMRAWFTG